jgi:hypothetical protein
MKREISPQLMQPLSHQSTVAGVHLLIPGGSVPVVPVDQGKSDRPEVYACG